MADTVSILNEHQKRIFDAILDAATATDFPRMLKPIEPREWQEFFVNEAAKLKPEIFE